MLSAALLGALGVHRRAFACYTHGRLQPSTLTSRTTVGVLPRCIIGLRAMHHLPIHPNTAFCEAASPDHRAQVSCCHAGMRRMNAPPALEVAAHDTWLDSDMCDEGSAAPTLAAGFSHVSIRTAELHMDLYRDPSPWVGCTPDAVTSAQQVLVGILRYAPPTLRGCTIGLAPLQDSTAQQLVLEAGNPSPDMLRSVYHTAAELAEGLRPHADAAGIRLELDEKRQRVHLTRM